MARQNYNSRRNDDRGGREVKKRSGCTAGIDRNGQPYVRGWNSSQRRGMITFYASPYSGTQEVQSQTGRTWQNWFVRIEFKDELRTVKTSGLYDPQSRKVIMPEVGMVANPGAPNGGYFGRFGK